MMEMPKVLDCSVTNCAYNSKKACHAMAITIGETEKDPACDTFFTSQVHGGVKEATAGVGACKTSECQFNKDFECAAPNIHVGLKGTQVDCLTFKTRH